MRSARHLRFVALAVVVIMAWVAAVPFRLNRAVNDLMAQTRAEQQAQGRLDDILTSVRDAETAQRGFVITGNDVFLEPYEDARRTLPAALRDAKDKARSDAERGTVWRVSRLVELKLVELDETMGCAAATASHASERVVGSLRGKLYMDELRQIVAAANVRSQSRRDALRAELLARSRNAFYVGLAATAFDIVALCVLLGVVMRMLQERRAIAARLEAQTGNSVRPSPRRRATTAN